MKKYATVPIRCKIRRFLKAVSNLCIKIKCDNAVSLCKDPDAVPEKTFRFGRDRVIRVRDLLLAVAAIYGAMLIGYVTFKSAFMIAVGRESRRRRR